MADGENEGKLIRLRFAGKCSICHEAVPAGIRALYVPERKQVTCMNCYSATAPGAGDTEAATSPEPGTSAAPVPSVRGQAGVSTRREYEKRAARHRQREEERIAEDARWRAEAVREHPILGRIASATTPKANIRPEPQSVRAWEVGARGEETLSKLLNGWANGRDRFVLHDRRIPGTRANIDHIAVVANGVWAIDAKHYRGLVESRDVGGWLRTDLRLKVGGRDRSKLLEGLAWQIGNIEETIFDATGEKAIPVQGILCFIDADWRWFAKPPRFGTNMHAAWPSAAVSMLAGEGYIADQELTSLAHLLADRFPPA